MKDSEPVDNVGTLADVDILGSVLALTIAVPGPVCVVTYNLQYIFVKDVKHLKQISLLKRIEFLKS